MNRTADIRKQRRIDAGIPRAEIASAIGVTERTLYRWENGHRVPTHEHARRWDTVLQVAALTRRRIELELSQEVVAERIGTTQATLSRWESGHRIPVNRATWRAWKVALHLDPERIAS